MKNWLLLLLCLFSFGSSKAQNSLPDVVVSTGLNDHVSALAMSPNGRFLAAATTERYLKVFDVKTELEFRTFSGFGGRIIDMVFSPNGQFLAVTTFQEELLIWKVETGELTYRSLASGSVTGIAFTKGGKQLVYLNQNGFLSTVNLETQKTIQSEIFTASITVDTINQKIWAQNHTGDFIRLTNQLEVEQTFPSKNPVYPSLTRSFIGDHGQLIAYGTMDFKFKVFDAKKNEIVFESKNLGGFVASIAADVTHPWLYILIAGSGNIKIFNWETMNWLSDFTEYAFEGIIPPHLLVGHPTVNLFAYASGDQIYMVDMEQKQTLKSFTTKVEAIESFDYNAAQSLVVIADKKIKTSVWDLKANKQRFNLGAFHPCKFSIDGNYLLATVDGKGTLGVFDTQTGEKVNELTTDGELIQRLAVSATGDLVAASGYMNNIYIWKLSSGKRVDKYSVHEQGALGIAFHPTKSWLATGGLDEKIVVYDFEKKKVEKTLSGQTVQISSLCFSPDGDLLASGAWDRSIWVRNTSDWSVKNRLKHQTTVHTLTFSQNGKQLISGGGSANLHGGSADNSVYVWELENGQINCKFEDHESQLVAVVNDNVEGRFVAAARNGVFKLQDSEQCKTIADFLTTPHGMITYTPDRFYAANRESVKAVAFRKGLKLLPFEQFDVYLNRPDIVLDRVGKVDKNLIKAYEYRYKKRLKKLGLDESSLKLNFDLPHVKNETDYLPVTNATELKLWVNFWDENIPLHHLNVYVNGFPLFGENGYPLKKAVKSIRKEITIPLIEGKNQILISCVNQQGVESLYEQIKVIKRDVADKPNLYIACIGVGNYQNEAYNLKYPVKDAQDMLATFQFSQQLFNTVHTRLMLDEAVVRDSLKSLSDFFAPCRYNDVAIVFIAGHGLLDKEYNYFFGTHNIDFNHPEINGIAYEELSALMGKITAYQKLLLMDTCHSGELDEEDVRTVPNAELQEGEVKFRGGTQAYTVKNGIGFENSIALSEQSFSDLRKGTGATVIASAGGTEYAMEGDQWENGLFTAIFKEGLIHLAADFNQNKSIELSEIRKYVYQRVKEESKKGQIPTSREENIYLDYTIFKP